ncbi:argininosuccinate lyase [Angelakisella massiliensis]|uniref:argininosuccinate lyase n=1 Tax=Angelakisella massiliensis TaxID=1871018 RepID=UPI0008F8184B|nr:argininosuccinate lyase [Angelakisella massiliensis]
MANAYETKLWGGRFREDEDALMQRFNSGRCRTDWLVEPDIQGSLAHVAMQVKCGMLTQEEGNILSAGLKELLGEYQQGKLIYGPEYEDVHTFVELNLIRKVGEVGKKLHTARSRNDQCNVDMKLYVKAQTAGVIGLIEEFQKTLQRVAEENPWIMPGYTHLQRAQVVTFKHHLLAYYEMMERDKRRLSNALEIMDQSPLGCGALAGTTHSIDRAYTAQLLGFQGGACKNFLDGVSDRDFVLETMADFSILMMHLSRLAEELVLWTSAEFGFVVLDDRYTTGSSIMPQKKNPDGAELVRGRTGRVYGDLFILLCAMKGLPLAYNKDLQEDKSTFYDALDVVTGSLQMMDRMIGTLKAKPEAMKQAVKKGFLNATEVADYLVKKGVAFRDAHGIVGEIVIYCEDHGKAIEELTLNELLTFSPVFDETIYSYIDYDNILQKGIKKEML